MSLYWPAGLPQVFLRDGYRETPLDNAMVVTPEQGEPTSFLEFTGDIEEINGALPPLAYAQKNMLKNFWRFDLKRGTLRFVWDHPTEFHGVELLFRQSPVFTSRPGGLWRADLQFWTLPT